MKKLISLLIALICSFSLFACGGNGDGSKSIKEITPTGEKVYAKDFREYVYDRQDAYFESDMAKSNTDKWFDVDMKMKMTTADGEEKITMFYRIDGKMGFVDGELLMEVKIELEAEYVSASALDSSTEKETVEVKGELILIDDVAYVDITVKEESDGVKQEQTLKQMGDIEDAFEYADIEDMIDFIGEPTDYESALYGLNISELINSIAGATGVDYYIDDDKIYIDARDSQEDTYAKTEEILQYAIEFEKDSAVVEKTNIYVMSFMQYVNLLSEINTMQKIEMRVDVKQIDSARITAPKTDGYAKV